MRQITIPMKKYDSKPTLSVYGYPALLDTGADIPVCCLRKLCCTMDRKK